MKKIVILILFSPLLCLGQIHNRNAIWCFGDSAGIDFNYSTPQTFTSQCKTRGSTTSIADTLGNLILYTAETPWGTITKRVRVFNAQNQILQNGDSIIGLGWYRENVVLPYPNHPNQYYLFSVGATTDYGLYYSKIDMLANAGLGTVIQKNIQLLPYQMQDGLQAIKHGNGRDWWIICHRWDISDNNFYKFLLTPNGLIGPYIQSIGDISYGSLLNMNFSQSGSKVAIVDYHGLFEIFNFDRCTGDFSSIPFFTFPTTAFNYNLLWNCEFSSNENRLYISGGQQISYLFQLNLLDSNPWQEIDTLWVQNTIPYSQGQLELAPNNKIYFATAWNDGIHYNYPYPDSAYYQENMNLGVINNPDNLGSSCDFQPFSFYLGGNRTYLGLPNNPNYDLPADSGSSCDSLPYVTVKELQKEKSNLNIFYHSGWHIAFVNAKRLRGEKYVLSVYDLMGKEIFKEEGTLSSSYFTGDLNCSGFANGMYIVNLQTEKEVLSKKFVKQ